MYSSYGLQPLIHSLSLFFRKYKTLCEQHQRRISLLLLRWRLD